MLILFLSYIYLPSLFSEHRRCNLPSKEAVFPAFFVVFTPAEKKDQLSFFFQRAYAPAQSFPFRALVLRLSDTSKSMPRT